MGTMRGGGMGMSMRAERSPQGAAGARGAADLPKRKPDLRKLWPQIWALVAPRKGLLSRPFPDGHQPRRRPGIALYLEAAA